MWFIISDDDDGDYLVSNFANADHTDYGNDYYKKHTINAKRKKIDNNFRCDLGINDAPIIKTRDCFTKDYNKKNNKYSGKDDKSTKKKKEKEKNKKEREKRKEKKKKSKNDKDKAQKAEKSDDADDDGDNKMKRTASHQSGMSIDDKDDNDADNKEEEKKQKERYNKEYLKTLADRPLHSKEFYEIENFSSNLDGNMQWRKDLGNYQKYDTLAAAWKQLHHHNKKCSWKSSPFYYKKKYKS